MNPKQFSELQKTITQSIDENIDSSVEKYVNGKIRRLDEKVDNYIKLDLEHKERDKIETEEWRKGADEKLAIVGSFQGFGKVALYILGFMSAIGAGFGAILVIIKVVTGRW